MPITRDDPARLVEGTGRPTSGVAAFYAADEFEDGGKGLAYAELDVGPRTMGLRRAGDGSCRFFRGDRCTVYEHRPLTCRIWPMTVRLDDAGRLAGLSVNRSVTCDYELDGLIDARALVRQWRADDRQDDRWQARVARWNRTRAGGQRARRSSWRGWGCRRAGGSYASVQRRMSLTAISAPGNGRNVMVSPGRIGTRRA